MIPCHLDACVLLTMYWCHKYSFQPSFVCKTLASTNPDERKLLGKSIKGWTWAVLCEFGYECLVCEFGYECLNAATNLN